MIQHQIINSCLLNQQHLYLLMQYPADMFIGKTKLMYEVLQNMYENNIDADLPSFMSHAQKIGTKIDVAEFMDKTSIGGSVINIKYTLDTMFEDYRKNQIKDHAVDLFKSVKAGDTNYQDFIEKIVEINDTVSIDSSECFRFSDNEDLDDMFKDFSAVKTGIARLDAEYIGFTNGDTSIVAARPGEGKSALAFQIAKKRKTLFFNLEMPKEQVVARMLHGETGVSAQAMLERTMTEEQREKVFKAYLKLQDHTELYMFNRPMSYLEIIGKIKTYNKLYNPELIIIDYIQRISGGIGNSPNERMTSISNGLKNIALDLNKPVMLLSQFSRAVSQQGREPVLSDLRDSGTLEQDASNVLFLHEGSIIIGKTRLGETGKINGIIFNKKKGIFENETFNSDMEWQHK